MTQNNRELKIPQGLLEMLSQAENFTNKMLVTQKNILETDQH
jgi:hypothetical protein